MKLDIIDREEVCRMLRDAGRGDLIDEIPEPQYIKSECPGPYEWWSVSFVEAWLESLEEDNR